MTDTVKLKTELGRIRGAIMSGSFDRPTALEALDAAELAMDAPDVPVPSAKPAVDKTKPAAA